MFQWSLLLLIVSGFDNCLLAGLSRVQWQWWQLKTHSVSQSIWRWRLVIVACDIVMLLSFVFLCQKVNGTAGSFHNVNFYRQLLKRPLWVRSQILVIHCYRTVALASEWPQFLLISVCTIMEKIDGNTAYFWRTLVLQKTVHTPSWIIVFLLLLMLWHRLLHNSAG